MDINSYIKDFGIADGTISKGRFLYTYVAGFFTYLIKISMSLLSIYMLLSVIRCVLVVAFFIIFVGVDSPMTVGKILFDALKDNTFYVFSVYRMESFVQLLLITAPIMVLLTLAGFAIMIYNSDALQELEDSDQLPRTLNILNTMHHHMMFFLSSVIALAITGLVIAYVVILYQKNPALDT